MLVFVPHHLCPTCCVAPVCRLWTNDLSSMALQPVSVQRYAWPRLCHALVMDWDLALQCPLAPRLHVCCCVAPHVVACCVAPVCRLWTHGLSSMAMQLVSVQTYAWPGLCHALVMVCDWFFQVLLAPRHHTCCCLYTTSG